MTRASTLTRWMRVDDRLDDGYSVNEAIVWVMSTYGLSPRSAVPIVLRRQRVLDLGLRQRRMTSNTGSTSLGTEIRRAGAPRETVSGSEQSLVYVEGVA